MDLHSTYFCIGARNLFTSASNSAARFPSAAGYLLPA